MPFQKGLNAWNSGLTKYTDERIALGAQKISETKIASGKGKLASKKIWESRSVEDRLAISVKISKTKKEFFKTKEGEEVARKHSDFMKSYCDTLEGKDACRRGAIAATKSMSEEGKKKRVENAVKAVIKRWSLMDKEERSKAAEPMWSKRTDVGAWWSSMSREDYDRVTHRISLGMKRCWAEMTDEERSKREESLSLAGIKSLREKNGPFFNTKPEIEMRRCLRENGIKYIQQYPIGNIKHAFVSDFYLPLYNIILEVDGKYWHSYPDGRDIDHIRTKELEDIGYRVLRFWEGEFDAQSVWREI